MQAKTVEQLRNIEANALLAERLRNFARGGLAPELMLRFPARPEIAPAHERVPEGLTAA